MKQYFAQRHPGKKKKKKKKKRLLTRRKGLCSFLKPFELTLQPS